jgi:hypothetical protein
VDSCPRTRGKGLQQKAAAAAAAAAELMLGAAGAARACGETVAVPCYGKRVAKGAGREAGSEGASSCRVWNLDRQDLERCRPPACACWKARLCHEDA